MEAANKVTILVENPLMRADASSVLGTGYHACMLRTPTTIVLGLSICSFALAQEGKPASTTPPPQVTATAAQYAVISKGRDVNVRTAASVEGGYPFFRVNKGAVVEVLYERYGWSRVQTSTPVFEKAFGYVNANALTVKDKTGTVTQRTTLRAPNLLQKGKVSASWEGLDPALQPETELKLIELLPGTTSGEPGVWKVHLPGKQKAWINSDFLRPATAQEIAAAKLKPLPPASDEIIALEEVSTTATETTNPGDSNSETEAVAAGTTTEDVEAEEVVLTPAEARAAKLAALDEAFRSMLKEDIQSAELELLQKQFQQFAQDKDATDLQRSTAESRSEVLALKVSVQDRLARLRSMKDRTRIDGENISATGVAMDFRAPFDVVGRLNASVVFNGKGTMPLLFRLQDPSSGHTIGYLVPDNRYDLPAMTGLMVGIVGRSDYNEALQLNVITPRRIDLVAAAPSRAKPTLKTVPPASNTPSKETVVEAETESDVEVDN